MQDIAVYDPKAFAFSNGVHVCEIDVDPETGLTRFARYSAVDDVGTVINPMIATGQVHGGVAQGFGQAVLEHVVYDAESDRRCAVRSWTMPLCVPKTQTRTYW